MLSFCMKCLKYEPLRCVKSSVIAIYPPTIDFWHAHSFSCELLRPSFPCYLQNDFFPNIRFSRKCTGVNYTCNKQQRSSFFATNINIKELCLKVPTLKRIPFWILTVTRNTSYFLIITIVYCVYCIGWFCFFPTIW